MVSPAISVKPECITSNPCQSELVLAAWWYLQIFLSVKTAPSYHHVSLLFRTAAGYVTVSLGASVRQGRVHRSASWMLTLVVSCQPHYKILAGGAFMFPALWRLLRHAWYLHHFCMCWCQSCSAAQWGREVHQLKTSGSQAIPDCSYFAVHPSVSSVDTAVSHKWLKI